MWNWNIRLRKNLRIQKTEKITPQILQEIKTTVNKLIPAYQKTIVLKGLSSDQIEFSIDIFYIGQILSERMKIDYITVSMNKAIQEMAYSGGGTIQSNIAESANADLIVKRCIELFNYFNDLVELRK